MFRAIKLAHWLIEHTGLAAVFVPAVVVVPASYRTLVHAVLVRKLILLKSEKVRLI